MSDVLWALFEVAVNFFQGFILVYFAYDFLGDKNNKKFFQSNGVLYGVILAVLISVMNKLTVFEHFYALLYVGVIFIYACFSLKGKLLGKAFVSIFSILIMLVSAAFTSNLFALFFDTTLNLILSDYSIERLIAVITTQLLIIYMISLSLKIMRNIKKNTDSLAAGEYILISVVLFISITIGTFLNFISLENISHNGRIFIVLVFAGIILINVTVSYLIVDLSKKNEAVRENEILRLQQEYNRQFISSANNEYVVIKKLRHDFKDSCSAIYTLLENGNIAQAKSYTQEYLGELIEKEIFVHTNNDIVNALINSKLTEAKTFGIQCVCLSVSDFSDIADIDLFRLLSNMLQNAITATAKIECKSKQIYLKITSDEYKYEFSIKNTIEKSVLSDNPELITSKKDKSYHGYGVSIIKDISKKYLGKASFYEEDDNFCCHVILKRHKN